MKKNLLLALTLTALTSIGLVSCGENGSKANFEIPEGYDINQEVTINFYTTQGKALKPITQAYIDEFNKIYPNIHIEMPLDSMGYPELRDQIKTELSIGAGPDVAYCYPDHVALYNKKKVVVQLDNLINDKDIGLTQEQIDDFIPGYYEEGRQFGDGFMYTLPWSKSTEIMYYNVEFLQNNNLEVPTHWFSNGENDTTSVDYFCKRCKEIDPDCIPLGYDSSDNWFITMCAQYNSPYTSATGDHFLFDNETNRNFVLKFKEWYEKGYITTQGLYGSYSSALFTSTEKEKSYISIGSSAGASHQVPENIDTSDGQVLPFHVGVASIPQVDPANPKVISQGPSVCILNQGDPAKVIASWLFVKYMTTSVGYQASFGMESGYVPVIKSVNENPDYAAFLEKSEQETTKNATEKKRLPAAAAKQCLAQADAYFTSPAFYGSSVARSEVADLLDAVISGSKTIDDAFADALAECEYNS